MRVQFHPLFDALNVRLTAHLKLRQASVQLTLISNLIDAVEVQSIIVSFVSTQVGVVDNCLQRQIVRSSLHPPFIRNVTRGPNFIGNDLCNRFVMSIHSFYFKIC